MNDKQLYESIKEIVLDVVRAEGLFVGQWHLGTVESVVSSTKLKVFVDGSDTAQTISCNPDVTFSVGSHVWVIYINGNARDKFVLSRRAI